MRGKIIFFITGLFFLPYLCWSGSQSTARILTYPVSARALGMAEAFVALADDLYAMQYNPAGLNQLPNHQIGMTYVKSLADTFYTYLGLAMPASMDASFGANVAYLDGGMMEWTDVDGSERQVKALSDYVFTLSGGLRIYGQNLVGVNIKYISSKLADTYTASALAFDSGILYQLMPDLRFGFVVQNVGLGMKYEQETDPLPTTLSFGLAYTFQLLPGHKLNAACDLKKPLDLDYLLHLGVEYIYNDFLYVRAGYKLGYDLAGLTCGGGFEWQFIQVDYALALMGNWDLNHHMSLTFRF